MLFLCPADGTDLAHPVSVLSSLAGRANLHYISAEREKLQIPVSCKYIQIIAGSAVRRFCFALALLPLSQVGCESALGDAAAGREALYVHVWQREATARAGFEGL